MNTRTLHLPPAWGGATDLVVAHAAGVGSRGITPPVVMVVGPKGSGKSTLGRMVTNALVTRVPAAASRPVAFLDLDLGQPEHTVPGCLSLTLVHAPLLSPPPVRVHHSARRAGDASTGALPPTRLGLPPAATVLHTSFLGALTPAQDPDAYVAAAYRLLAAYREHAAAAGTPLVINAHGWIRGIGYDVLQQVLTAAAPTHFYHLDPELATPGGRSRGGGGEGATTHERFVVPPAVYGATAATPAPVVFRLPAWHAAGTVASEDSTDDSGSVEGDSEGDGVVPAPLPRASPPPPPPTLPPPPPPRAVRSPSDLRGARWLVYFLAGLRPPPLAAAAQSVAAAAGGAIAPAVTAAASAAEAEWARRLDATFGRVLTDAREARAPCRGHHSPAAALRAAEALLVPAHDLLLLADASACVGVTGGVGARPHAAAPAAVVHPAALVGSVVGMVSAAGAAAVARLPPGAVAWHAAHSLPLRGVGYVRAWHAATGELAVVAPISDAALADVDTLVAWTDAHDLPPQLLFADELAGDPHAFKPATVAPLRAATARATGPQRKQLGRKGRGGGPGAPPRR